MAISKIQLRGISRNPSDKMTADGGCAESLNVYLDNDELVPVMQPKDISASINLTANVPLDDIYLHKVSSGENPIIIGKDDDVVYLAAWVESRGYVSFLSLESGEELKEITSLGNTLVVAGSENTYYCIYSKGKYEFLGNAIPHIPLELKPRVYDKHPSKKDSFSVIVKEIGEEVPAEPDGGKLYLLDPAVWEKAIAENSENLIPYRNKFWSGYQLEMLKLVKAGLFYYPVFMRYALKLFDGTYIYQSVPILLGAGFRRMMECTIKKEQTGVSDSFIRNTIVCTLNNAYSVDARLFPPFNLDKWKDVIESIDLFISEPILYPSVNSDFFSMKQEGEQNVITFQHEIGSEAEDEAVKNMLLSTAQFYKIRSYPITNFSAITSGEEIKNREEYFLTEKLFVLDRLPDDFRSHHTYSPTQVSTFNNRILASGMTERLYGGEPNPNALIMSSSAFVDQTLEVMYEIVGSSGESMFTKPNGIYGHDALSLPPIVKVLSDTNIELMSSNHGGFVAYPDTRCVAMYFHEEGNWKKVPMSPHPYLQCSYAYLGIDKILTQALPDFEMVSGLEVNNVSRTYASEYIFQSAVDNPFFFPASGRKKISGAIIGYAVASRALSQGQFGQFPLYVFTTEGIWAMSTADDGSFLTMYPLSREICSNPDSLTSIDQAVVFMTKKGLMLLQESDIVDLSPNMNGRHYNIEPLAFDLINTQEGFDVYSDALSDRDAFLSFMSAARIGYDYTGKRLICFNESKPYQYVYKLDTQTWHKVAHEDCFQAKPLNSYPECFVKVVNAEGETKLMDFSTDLSDLGRRTEKAVIATRPFDLDAPDILKTIKDVRIRGQFPKGAVKFILLGSQDGINFYTLSTLRGKAWKMFRIIILADLDATERISWIDVSYETKLTDRLR